MPTKKSVVNLTFIIPKTQNFPTVVWFHGGGLRGGNKSVPKQLQEKVILLLLIIDFTQKLNPVFIMMQQQQ